MSCFFHDQPFIFWYKTFYFLTYWFIRYCAMGVKKVWVNRRSHRVTALLYISAILIPLPGDCPHTLYLSLYLFSVFYYIVKFGIVRRGYIYIKLGLVWSNGFRDFNYRLLFITHRLHHVFSSDIFRMCPSEFGF